MDLQRLSEVVKMPLIRLILALMKSCQSTFKWIFLIAVYLSFIQLIMVQKQYVDW